MADVRVVAPCSLVDSDGRFRGLYCHHHQGDGKAASGKVGVDVGACFTRQIFAEPGKKGGGMGCVQTERGANGMRRGD
jgi:hypothetical protein